MEMRSETKNMREEGISLTLPFFSKSPQSETTIQPILQPGTKKFLERELTVKIGTNGLREAMGT